MCLYEHQKKAIEEQTKYKKCLINMWCGTGKTRTFTIDLFNHNEKTNVIVFPSLGLINQYSNDYVLSNEEPFKTEYEKYKCLAFCSDNDRKLKSKGTISFTTDEKKLNTFLKKRNNKMLLVTYQSFEKFINICSVNAIKINNLIFDEAHHIIGDRIQNIVFNNEELDTIVDKTRYYTATPVNKNGIIMYDRDDPENSDCGPLAYEYLYYQAVEDGICKPFESQISLYTQKQEYKDKYQPIFESIIRACLSGKYNYWNILTYHSFVNENEDMNDNISFVKDFASTKNQKLVKKLFTKIQNEEFPHTKATYSVENVILKGVHSETHTRQQIIKDFDKKVPGRIYILSSCGILNEGIDTKWANMGIPINPSKSIVKESQRIGRLVRIPEKEMPPAIILIPCEVDITKYASMDTAELRDQMIREELSECGNFNTALNVISAFKYQYDPDLFEMCLKYPNMYAPKEVKDNLEKQGLIIEESKGTLLDNLKYICEQEDIELDTASFEGETESDILNEIAELSEKTIEIHTQNYDEPVKYFNPDAYNDEPLRLFHCDDENSYAPIVNKDKKQRIKRRTTTAPKKRPKLFDIHTHPDLEVLWKISESSIDLTKTFSQGVLDVDISWNAKRWEDTFEKLKKFIDKNGKRPSSTSKNPEEKFLGNWIGTQQINYTKKQQIMKTQEIYDTWTEFIIDPRYKEYFTSNEDQWKQILEKVKVFMDTYGKRPSTISKNPEEKFLGSWISNKQINYTKKIKIMGTPEIYDTWTQFINDSRYKEYFTSNEDQWKQTIEKLKKFIDKNGKRPIQKSKNPEEKFLGIWIGTQQKSYTKKQYIMKTPEIYDIWTEFINDSLYKEYFISNEDQWKQTIEKVKEFIDTNGKRPTKRLKNPEEKVLGTWMSDQLTSYTKKQHIMKTSEIYDTWTEFINDPRYKEYFNTNEENWKQILEKVKEFIDTYGKRPSTISKNPEEKILGSWIGNQQNNYTKKQHIMKTPEIYDMWTEFVNDPLYKEYLLSPEEKWKQTIEKVKVFIDTNGKRPRDRSKNPEEKLLGSWIGTQQNNYTKKQQIMKTPEIYDMWTEFVNDSRYSKYFNTTKKKDMSKPEIIPKKTDNEIKVERPQRSLSELSKLHKEYKTKNSQNLNTYFKEHPEKWKEYHKISKENEESFIEEELPRNKMIKYLENLPGKKHKVVADLGCGFAEINQHFKDNSRFTFHNFDHISANDYVISRDIKNTGLDDYSVDNAILSLAMWGSNCKEYLKEAHRILDTGGTLLIAEAYKRWNKELDEHENPINRLVKLLEENNFTIIKNIENKFMFIECRKN